MKIISLLPIWYSKYSNNVDFKKWKNNRCAYSLIRALLKLQIENNLKAAISLPNR
jgi:hypothetical protein